jgi:hypothetical protein
MLAPTCIVLIETKWITDIFHFYHSKLSGDDFLIGSPSDGEEEDALIDMDLWPTNVTSCVIEHVCQFQLGSSKYVFICIVLSA